MCLSKANINWHNLSMTYRSKRGIFPKNFIMELRSAREWTLRDLENKTGWSHQTLSNLELSKADLTWTKIMKLAAIFECHPLEITQGPGTMTGPRDDKERELLRTYRGLADGEKQVFNSMVDGLKKASGVEKKSDGKNTRTKNGA